jgi:hypothetical protein
LRHDEMATSTPSSRAVDEFECRLGQFLGLVGDVDVVGPGGVVEALQVFLPPEDSRTVGRLVTADALEDAGAVVEPVGQDVDVRVVEVDELAVHPDRVDALVHLRSVTHVCPPMRGAPRL